MRIKFEKGMTPEKIAEVFVDFIRENDITIGSVNMYVQTYDENMKIEPFNRNEYLVCDPSEATKAQYDKETVNARRKRMKVVV
jgi:hypothetical protein